MQGAGFMVQGAGCRVQGAGCRVQGQGQNLALDGAVGRGGQVGVEREARHVPRGDLIGAEIQFKTVWQ